MGKRTKNKPKLNLGGRLNGQAPVAVATAPPLRLDLGCGPGKRQDGGPWTGVDSIAFPGVDVVADLTQPWPWRDGSVTEVNASHFVEHLTNLEGRWERVHFFNELYRVLVVGGKATVVMPHWCSERYYGDPTHKEPFSEMGYYYLLRSWRLGSETPCVTCNGTGALPAGRCGACGGNGKIVNGANAPHTDATHNPNGYSCDFEAVWGYSVHPAVQVKSAEAQQFALQNYKAAAMDLIATLTKRAP